MSALASITLLDIGALVGFLFALANLIDLTNAIRRSAPAGRMAVATALHFAVFSGFYIASIM
jgi:hypothetical protein